MAAHKRQITVLRAARGMPLHPSPLLETLLTHLVGTVHFASEERLESLRQAHKRGPVVYVHRSRNVADYLGLHQALRQHQLPLAAFVGGLRVWLFQPLLALWRIRRPKSCRVADRAKRDECLLSQTLHEGKAAMIFLRKPLTLTSGLSEFGPDFIASLITTQRELSKPIFLLPQLVAYGHLPGKFQPSLGDTVFGAPEQPGLLRALLKMIAHHGDARVLAGEPINLQDFLRDNAALDEDKLRKKLRWVLLHFLAREDQVLNGPPLKSPNRMQAETFRDVELKNTIELLLNDPDKKPGLDSQALMQRAKKYYREIAARFDINVLNLFDAALTLIFSRIYRGIVTKPEDMERIRRALRRGPTLLIPSHRSHVDYLVLSQIMAHNGMIPPHIAAGVNLSFWPIGWVFRHSGAFFMRRRFRGNPLYVAVFRAYLKKLIREGFPQEFFIEGTRSRTGKSLKPKLGLLGLEVDAYFASLKKDLMLVPMSIGYEKVIEEREYQRELEGANKKNENVVGLLKATRVLLANYGRVYVHADEPISLREFFASQNIDHQDHSPEERQDVVTELGAQIVRRIDAVTPLTPTSVAATCLLGHPHKRLSWSTLMHYAQRIVEHTREVSNGQVRLSPALTQLDEAMRQSVQRLLDEDLVSAETNKKGEPSYRISSRGRPLLNRYKNSLMHFFVPEAIVATAMESLRQDPGPLQVQREQLAQRSKTLCEILDQEFMLPRAKDFAAFFTQTLQRGAHQHYVVVDADMVALPQSGPALALHRFVASLLAPFVESYWVSLRAVASELGQGLSAKDLAAKIYEAQKRGLKWGELRYPEGVSKPIAIAAVTMLREQGVLRLASKGHDELVFSPTWEAQRLSLWAEDLARFRPR